MEDNKNKNLNEPVVPYQNKTMRLFNSFEEMNEADAEEMAAISPLDHLRNTVGLIKRVFAKDLKKPMDLRIKFK